MLDINLKLTPIDFATLTKKTGLELGATYVVMVRGELLVGTFNMQWYGYNFYPTYGHNSIQFDPPPDNCSNWQLIWKVENAKEIADALEPEYAVRRRRYCIDHSITSGGVVIDESAPVEAFYYHPKVAKMLPNEEEEYPEDNED